MALIHADRVQETTATTGTGAYTLAGATPGFRTFSAGVGVGNTCWYAVTMGSDWEVGVGTLTGTTTLARTTILASSNAGAAVNWAAGTKYAFVTLPGAVIGAQGGVALRSQAENDAFFFGSY